MNRRQLLKLGVPADAIPAAMVAVQSAVAARQIKGGAAVKQRVKQVLEGPSLFVTDSHFGGLAQVLLAAPQAPASTPVSYRCWGTQIEPEAHRQMRDACAVPHARGAALMPDAHVGYGLPIGGVLACEGAVIPYAVGVDIACRMKLSVLDLPPESLESKFQRYCQSLERGTRFGVGSEYERRQYHPVMDQDWTVSRIVRESKDRAWKQLGTSGSGNHFVEFGTLTLASAVPDLHLAPGKYVALLSHSGSRGTGAAICSTFSNIARVRLPSRYAEFGRLAWLELDSQEGEEYWRSMSLMGDYAAANHAIIHRNVTERLGAQVIDGVENHHNFAWLEEHGGRQLVVHRKGATPAGLGVLGVIPGSMGDPAFVVRGRGLAESFSSAAHGAGRCMSRTAAKATFNLKAVRQELAQRGIHVISAGADEVPGVYKNIFDVMSQQRELVELVARFDPKIVKMCGDGSRAED
jgi:tRNA-splicing ligase RtcB